MLLIYYFWARTEEALDHALLLLLWSLSILLLIPLTSILLFLGYNQTLLLINDQTTIERLELEEDKEMGLEVVMSGKYDKGCVRNTSEILGNDILWWWYP